MALLPGQPLPVEGLEHKLHAAAGGRGWGGREEGRASGRVAEVREKRTSEQQLHWLQQESERSLKSTGQMARCPQPPLTRCSAPGSP